MVSLVKKQSIEFDNLDFMFVVKIRTFCGWGGGSYTVLMFRIARNYEQNLYGQFFSYSLIQDVIINYNNVFPTIIKVKKYPIFDATTSIFQRPFSGNINFLLS